MEKIRGITIVKKTFPDGSYAYFDKETDKVVKLNREYPGKLGRSPNYARRFITPQTKGENSWRRVYQIKD